MFIDYITLMLINLVAGLVLLAAYRLLRYLFCRSSQVLERIPSALMSIALE